MNIPNNAERIGRSNNNNNGINIQGNENNNFLVNDDGMFIDDNNILEDECITPKDDEENINSRRKRTDRLNRSENKNMANERRESQNVSGSNLGRGLNMSHAQNSHEQYINRHEEGSNSSVFINGAPSECALPGSAHSNSAHSNNAHSNNALPNSALPNSALPNSALPNSAFPNSALPNSAFPNSAFPNNALPNNALPNSAIPNSTTQTIASNLENNIFLFNGDNIQMGYDRTMNRGIQVNTGFPVQNNPNGIDYLNQNLVGNNGGMGMMSVDIGVGANVASYVAARECENQKNDTNISNGGTRDNLFVNESSNYFMQNVIHAESNHADEVGDGREEREEQNDERERQFEEMNRIIEENESEPSNEDSERGEVRTGENMKKKDDEIERNILHAVESISPNDDLAVESILNNENQFEHISHLNTLNSVIGGAGGGVVPLSSTGGLTLENFIQSLKRELTCPICLDYFYLPVTMNCGHTFCRYCIGHNKLNGKNCPLCRQALGHTVCINTIISNLVRIYNLRRKCIKVYKSIEIVNTVDEMWWNENFIKAQVSVPLFLRIFLGDMISVPVFFDDLTACIVDFFTANNLWSKAKWVFNINDCKIFSELIGYDKDNKEMTNDRLHAWVENYITHNPSMCIRKDEQIILKIIQDRTHKIDSQLFDSSTLPNRLPWDGGRHVKSLIHMPHSSVSLSHLIFVKAENENIGVVDCGSTIGTMIKVNNNHVLKEGDIIHIGDRLEVTVSIDKNTAGMPYKGYVWDKKSNKVLDRHELKELMKEKDKEGEAAVEEDEEEGERKKKGGENENCGTNEKEEVTEESRMENRSEYRIDNRSEQMVEQRGENQENFINITEENIPSHCEIIESNLLIKFDFGSVKDEITLKTEYIDPKGVVLGRGPYAQSSYKKLSVTNSNGYVSREHCLIYYDGTKPIGERWLLRDTSTLGTFLKIPSFSEPVPLPVGTIFKAGQCKIEVCSRENSQHSQNPARSFSLLNTNNRPNLGHNHDDSRNNGNGSNNSNNHNNGNGRGGGGGGYGNEGGSGQGSSSSNHYNNNSGHYYNNNGNHFLNQGNHALMSENLLYVTCGESREISSNDNSSVEDFSAYNLREPYNQQGENNMLGGRGGYWFFNETLPRDNRMGYSSSYNVEFNDPYDIRRGMERNDNNGRGNNDGSSNNVVSNRMGINQHHNHNRDTYFYNYLQHRNMSGEGNNANINSFNGSNENSDNENGNNDFTSYDYDGANNNGHANDTNRNQNSGNHGNSNNQNHYNDNMGGRNHGVQENGESEYQTNGYHDGRNLFYDIFNRDSRIDNHVHNNDGEINQMSQESNYNNMCYHDCNFVGVRDDEVSICSLLQSTSSNDIYVNDSRMPNPFVYNADNEGCNNGTIRNHMNVYRSGQLLDLETGGNSFQNNQIASTSVQNDLSNNSEGANREILFQKSYEEIESRNGLSNDGSNDRERTNNNSSAVANVAENIANDGHHEEENDSDNDEDLRKYINMRVVEEPKMSEIIIPYKHFLRTVNNYEKKMNMNPQKKSNKRNMEVVEDARNGLVHWNSMNGEKLNILDENNSIVDSNNMSSRINRNCNRTSTGIKKKRNHSETFSNNNYTTVREKEERGNNIIENEVFKWNSKQDDLDDNNVYTKNINTPAAHSCIFTEIESFRLMYNYIISLGLNFSEHSMMNRRHILEDNEEFLNMLNSSNVQTKEINSLNIFPTELLPAHLNSLTQIGEAGRRTVGRDDVYDAGEDDSVVDDAGADDVNEDNESTKKILYSQYCSISDNKNLFYSLKMNK
ncbi:zinc finger protein [Plasmodium gonderi]|uniref:E3 ubiquitin-protein ligase CHFR n=1 Tax=Plasmodium gonderi TaxID=77519 RepID=A0A1Y1JMG8_PLAGO|nr:zinc finger protein [Plasmodium gonderi]GAW82788.1 zinc finger protein [Plasmodium gonderi]